MRAGGAGELGHILRDLELHKEDLQAQNEELSGAQRKLEESRSRFADLFDKAPFGYLTLDATGRISQVNLTTAGILGREAAQLEGRPLGVLLARSDARRLRDHLHGLQRGEESAEVELDLAGRGSVRRVLVLSVRVRDTGDPDVLCRTALVDMTNHKRADAALSETQARLALVLSNTSAVLYTAAPEHPYGCTFVGDRIRAQLGYEPSDFTGKPEFWAERIHPDDAPEVFAKLHLLPEEDSFVNEYRFLHQDGSWHWMRDEVVVIRDGEGRPVELLGCWFDITDRKLAEEALRRPHDELEARVRERDELRRSQAQLAEAQAIGQIGSWEWRVAEDRVDWSDELHQLYGLARGAFPESYASYLELLHPDDREPLRQATARTLSSGAPLDIEHRIVWPDGSVRWIHGHAGVIADESGRPARLVGTAQDITMRKEAEQRHAAQFAVTCILAESTDFSTASATLLEEFCRLLDWDVGELWRLNPQGGALHLHHFRQRTGIAASEFEAAGRDLAFAPGEGVPGRAWARGAPIWIGDLTRDHELPRAEAAARAGLHVALAFPIANGGSVSHVLCFYRRHTAREDPELLQLCSSLGDQISQFTEGRRTVAALLESEQFNREIIASVGEGIAVCDREMRFVLWNPFMEELTGQRACEVLGKRPMDLFPFLRGPEIEAIAARILAGEDVVVPDQRFEFPDLGKVGWATSRIAPHRNAAGDVVGLIATVHDITERKRLEGDLTRLSTRLLQMQDSERRRIARTLHEEMGQMLAMLSMDVSILNKSIETLAPEAQQALVESQALTERCLREIRTLSYLLHPPLLDEAGLVSALRWYAEGYTQRSGVRVILDLPSQFERLPADVETSLFRIAQEALTNVHRHSGSPTARIRLARDPVEIVLEIEDVGCGLRSLVGSADSPAVGVGIMGMRERMRLLGGRLELEGAPGRTTVRAVLPLGKLEASPPSWFRRETP